MGTKQKDGQQVELTPSEQAEHDAAQAAGQEHQAAEAVKKAQRAEKLASGKAKLKELGLDDDEIKALTGE